MQVWKYIPDKLYGFAMGGDGKQVFFHMQSFEPGPVLDPQPGCESCPEPACVWAEMPPPPVLGESVQVDVDLDAPHTGNAPRASKVIRVTTPTVVQGTIESFDTHRGYGFIHGEDGQSYHLHRSEVVDNRIPLPGKTVVFYAGVRQGKPRACHVKVCR